MPHRLSLSLAALAICLAGAASADTTAPAARIISGFSHPESVLIGPSLRYVSNIGPKLDPVTKDGDGFISLLDAQGGIVNLRAFTGLDAPKGMALSAGILYVADIDRIVGFDPQTLQQTFVAQVDCAQPCLLNDIAVVGDRLLVTDTLRGQVYDLDPGTGVFALLAEGIPGANGILWDKGKNRAVIVALGADFSGGDLFSWSASEGARKLPDSPHGIFDGVALLPDGRLLVSDWVNLTPQPGALLTADAETGAVGAFSLDIPIRGPADFSLDATGNSLWIPAMVDGTVVVLPLSGG